MIAVLILGIACLGIAAFRGMETRFLIAGIVPLAWSAIDLFFAFTQSSIDSQAEKVTDERDRYIAMKSSRKALLITNYVMVPVNSRGSRWYSGSSGSGPSSTNPKRENKSMLGLLRGST